jgi:hypothetical protein
MSNDPMNRTSPQGRYWLWAIIIGLLALVAAWLSTFGRP